MSYRRGLVRVWIVGSGFWIAYWAWHYVTICNLDQMSDIVGGGNAITCRFETTGNEPWGVTVIRSPALRMLWNMGIVTFGLPLCVIFVGIAAHWAIVGFAGKPKPK